MATAKDLIGTWRGDAMFAPDSQNYEVLVFHMDGTGFIDFYESGKGRAHYFRWSVQPPDGLQLTGYLPLPAGEPEQHTPRPVADALVSFQIEISEGDTGGRVRSVTLEKPPVDGASNRFRFGGDGPAYVTFQCSSFPRQPDDYLFQGEAVALFLADQLRERAVEVSDVSEVYFGACHYFCAAVAGHQLGVGANWDKELNAWWLRIDPPVQGAGDEVENLCQMLRPILEAVDELHHLEWHSTDPWQKYQRNRL
jgi:hypothetical protein